MQKELLFKGRRKSSRGPIPLFEVAHEYSVYTAFLAHDFNAHFAPLFLNHKKEKVTADAI
jgi:hypothetical protein